MRGVRLSPPPHPPSPVFLSRLRGRRVRGQCRTVLMAGLLFLGFTLPAQAQAPEVSFFTPSGVQRGTKTTLKWIGSAGKDACSAVTAWPGLALEPGAKPDELVVTVSADAPPGVAEVWVKNSDGVAPPRALFVTDTPEVAEVEPNEHWRKAQKLVGGEGQPASLDSGVAITGVFGKSGDVDVFAVPLEAGRTLVATVESRRLDAPTDPVIQIVSPTGFVLEQNDDDHGFDPLLAFTATETGTYFVRMFAFPATPDTAIRFSGGATWGYRLTLSTGPVGSHVLPLGRPGPANVGEAVPDAAFDVGIVGWNLPGGVTRLPFGVAPFKPREGWPIPPASMLPSPAFPLVLAAGRMAPAPVGAKLAVEPGEGQPRDLGPAPACLSGTISGKGEMDTYTISALKGQKLRIRVLAREFDSLLDPLVRLMDPDGKPFREVDDEGRGEADVDLTQDYHADAAFRIAVTDRYGHGGPRYHYRLDVEVARPDVILTLPAVRHGLKQGGQTEIVVDLKREQGFEKPVVLKSIDLPAGVTCDEVTSPGKGDASKQVKVVLKATADAAAYLGLIRIVGHVEGEATPRMAVRPATPVLGASPDVWLFVGPK